MPPWSSAKAKVQLRLSVQRLRTLQQKKEAQAKSSRRDIATLIEKGKIETARIKVEGVINEDIYVELLELLELYCELLLARFGILDQNTREPDPGISEGVCSIIYAAPRTELKELHILRDILMHKYGREFSVAVMENQNGCVSSRVAKKLEVYTPSAELVNAYMKEIARGYSVDWTSPGDDGDGEGGVKESAKDGEEDAEKEKEAVAVALPADNDNNGRTPKLPDLPPTENEAKKTKTNQTSAPPEPPEDDFEALQKRFAALKKR